MHACVASARTPLRQLLNEWNARTVRHRLVKNERGFIDGIVDLHYIERMLAAENPVERARWEVVTAGAVADAIFSTPREIPPQAAQRNPTPAVVLGIPICDRAGCAAIVADGETYVNWSRVSAALQQHQFDSVTQLPTRLAFNRRLREEINRSARSGQSLAVLLIDLDYFKEINDQFGHAAGDAVLALIADSLRAGVRSYDFVARYGGDEFAIICHDCQPQSIGLPILRLQTALASRLEANTDLGLRLSLSIGAAAIGRIDGRCTPEEVVQRADTCLYQAKSAGRATAFAVELDCMGIPLAEPFEIGGASDAGG